MDLSFCEEKSFVDTHEFFLIYWLNICKSEAKDPKLMDLHTFCSLDFENSDMVYFIVKQFSLKREL